LLDLGIRADSWPAPGDGWVPFPLVSGLWAVRPQPCCWARLVCKRLVRSRTLARPPD